MKMMGMESWMSWIGWFIYSMMLNVVSVTMICFFYKFGMGEEYPPVMDNGNFFVLWIFLMMYCMTTLCFLFAVSTFFKRRKRN